MKRTRLKKSGSKVRTTRLPRTNKTEIAETLRQKLVAKTGCSIQHTGWPCNTCFHAMDLPLKHNIHDYWEAVLALRGDYPELEQKPELIKELTEALRSD